MSSFSLPQLIALLSSSGNLDTNTIAALLSQIQGSAMNGEDEEEDEEIDEVEEEEETTVVEEITE